MHKKIRRFHLGTAALLTALVLVAGYLGIGYLAMSLGGRAYGSESYDTADSRFSFTKSVYPGPVGDWRADFGLGTTLIKDGDETLDEGVSHLETALDKVPVSSRRGNTMDTTGHECRVRRNLSLGYELQGDVLVANGEREGAVEKYLEAIEALDLCETPSSEPVQRLEQKAEDAGSEQPDETEEPTEDPTDGGGNDDGDPDEEDTGEGEESDQGSGQGSDQQPEDDPRLNELSDRMDQGRDEYNDNQERGRDLSDYRYENW